MTDLRHRSSEREILRIDGVGEALESSFPGYRLCPDRLEGSRHKNPSAVVRFFSIRASGTTVDLVLKTSNPERGGRSELALEASCLRYFGRHGVAVPALLSVDPRGEWLLMRRTPGRRLSAHLGSCRNEGRSARPAKLPTRMGRLVAAVHATHPAGGEEPALPSFSSEALVRIQRRHLKHLATSYRWLFTPLLDQLVVRLPRNEPLCPAHGDLSAHNIILTPHGRLVALDWAEAKLAPPAAEVAFVTSWSNTICRSEKEISELIAAYHEASGIRLPDLNFHQALDYLTQGINTCSGGGDPRAFLQRAAAKVRELSAGGE